MTEQQRQLAERLARVLRIPFDYASQVAELCTDLEAEAYAVDGPNTTGPYLVDLILKARQRAAEERYRAEIQRASDEADRLHATLRNRQ